MIKAKQGNSYKEPCKFIHVPHSKTDKTICNSIAKQLEPTFDDYVIYKGSYLIADDTILLVTDKRVSLIAPGLTQSLQVPVNTIHKDIDQIWHCDLTTDQDSYIMSCGIKRTFDEKDYKTTHPTQFYQGNLGYNSLLIKMKFDPKQRKFELERNM